MSTLIRHPTVTDPVLKSRRACEATHLKELVGHAPRIVLEPWAVGALLDQGHAISKGAGAR